MVNSGKVTLCVGVGVCVCVCVCVCGRGSTGVWEVASLGPLGATHNIENH